MITAIIISNEAIEYAKECQSNGYVIIDIQIRDFEVSE